MVSARQKRWTATRIGICIVILLLLFSSQNVSASEQTQNRLVDETLDALENATLFFRSIATEGGYLWKYSVDLQERWGEGRATKTQIWVQPPGTPSVGMAFLRAYEATHDTRYLDAAKSAADALAWGQLESGGWTYLVDFSVNPARLLYRRAEKDRLTAKQIERRRNWTTFDDNTTQSALRFLMAVLQTEGMQEEERDKRIRAALEYGLAGMLRAQYPNGAWPQGYDGRIYNPQTHPEKRASVPDDWPREYPGHQNYWTRYTFNDNTMRDCVLTMLEAYERFGHPEYLESVNKAMDFILRAQMPEPQAAWAQQYDFDMTPIWARKFEPPSVCTSESIGVLRLLLDFYLKTGEQKYFHPIPSAVRWLEQSRLEDGRWARFYELGTNLPLYFTQDYQLVHTDRDLPTHYSFRGDYGVTKFRRTYEAIVEMGREAYLAQRESRPLTAEQRIAHQQALEPRIREVLAALDRQGRWVSDGQVESRVFIRNVHLLCDYLEVCQLLPVDNRSSMEP